MMERAGLLITLLVLAIAPTLAIAEEGGVGELRIAQAWSRATPPGTPVAVGYLEIANTGQGPERLVGAASPVAGRVTIHRSMASDGSTRMEAHPEGVVIPAGETVVFEPGGYHLMLMQLAEPLEKGQRVPLTLRFERSGDVGIELDVRSLTATGPGN